MTKRLVELFFYFYIRTNPKRKRLLYRNFYKRTREEGGRIENGASKTGAGVKPMKKRYRFKFKKKKTHTTGRAHSKQILRTYHVVGAIRYHNEQLTLESFRRSFRYQHVLRPSAATEVEQRRIRSVVGQVSISHLVRYGHRRFRGLTS